MDGIMMDILISGIILFLPFYGVYRLCRAISNMPADKLVRRLALEHQDALALKFLQSVRVDEYGKAKYDQWSAEVDYFARSVIEPKLKGLLQGLYYANGAPRETYKLITQITRKRVAEIQAAQVVQPVKAPTAEPEGGIGYEAYIAETLRHLGWSAVTSVGRAGGVIAEKNRLRVAVRPVLQDSPVDAPEIRAALVGKDAVRADWAAVVTNGSFTRAAEHAAASDGVILLPDDRLAALERLCTSDSARRSS